MLQRDERKSPSPFFYLRTTSCTFSLGFSALMTLVNGDEVGMIIESDLSAVLALSDSGGVYLCCTADPNWLF
jgi:hypothetical protein